MTLTSRAGPARRRLLRELLPAAGDAAVSAATLVVPDQRCNFGGILKVHRLSGCSTRGYCNAVQIAVAMHMCKPSALAPIANACPGHAAISQLYIAVAMWCAMKALARATAVVLSNAVPLWRDSQGEVASSLSSD